MAAPMKKRVTETELKNRNTEENVEKEKLEDNGLEMEESDGDEQDQMDTGEVQVDFEARNLEDSDFHGIKSLLQQLFIKANINSSELTETLISQNYIGSVIKQIFIPEDDDEEDSDDDLETYGLISVINITERQKLECIQQLKSYLTERCAQCSDAQKKALNDTISDSSKQVGFLINERFINIPAQIALPSFQSLWKEVDSAVKKKMKYQFTDYVMICKTLKMTTDTTASGGQKKKKGGSQNFNEQRVFLNPEEEFFFQEASTILEFSVLSERDTAISGQWENDEEDLEPYRTVLLIPSDKMPAIMAKLTENLAQ